jgi:pilus assembly protein CpaF
MSEVEVPFPALQDQINSAVDVLIQLTRLSDGSRKIAEISLLDSHARQPFHLTPLSRFTPEPLAPDGQVRGAFTHLPLPRAAADRLSLAGEPVPPVFGVGEG